MKKKLMRARRYTKRIKGWKRVKYEKKQTSGRAPILEIVTKPSPCGQIVCLEGLPSTLLYSTLVFKTAIFALETKLLLLESS